MTGAEIGVIIQQIAAVLTAIGVIYSIYAGQKTRAHVETAVAGVATAVAVVTAVDAKVESTVASVGTIGANVEKLKTQTDGLQSKLIEAVENAAGLKARADLAAEQRHDQAIIDSVKAEIGKANGAPQPVEIVQPPDAPVPVDQTIRIESAGKESR